jgi:hypothetical protein
MRNWVRSLGAEAAPEPLSVVVAKDSFDRRFCDISDNINTLDALKHRVASSSVVSLATAARRDRRPH